jgi:hypothetical protein
VWACPVCSASILTHRALEIGAVLGQAVAEGFALGFGTLTMRHRRGEPLKGLWDAAGKGWRRAISGKQWVAIQGRHGVEGWVRVWEVTDGQNGWHVHVHFVVVLPGAATAADLDAVAGGMFERWSRGLVAAGREAPRLVGQEWHLVAGDDAAGDLAEYLFKLTEQADRAKSLGLELAHTQPGRARGGLATRPVWSLVHAIADSGDLATLPRWHEWEKGSKGRRQVGWSRLRERFQPEAVEVTDAEIADRETGTAADDVAVISHEGWQRLVRIHGGCVDVLEALERGGVPEMVEVLEGHGVEFVLVAR